MLEAHKYKKHTKSKRLERPPVVKLLLLAEEFQGLLDRGAVNHRADIARHYCMSRARVTQLMHLLDLHSEIRQFIHSLGPEVSPRYVAAFMQLDKLEQLTEATRLFPTFKQC